jgi:hypothetical protein
LQKDTELDFYSLTDIFLILTCKVILFFIRH